MDGMDESEIQGLECYVYSFFLLDSILRSCKLLFWNNYLVKREKLLTLVISLEESKL